MLGPSVSWSTGTIQEYVKAQKIPFVGSFGLYLEEYRADNRYSFPTQVSVYEIARLFGEGAGVGIERLPALFWREMRHRSTPGIGEFSHTALDRNGVGRAFLGADLAPDALGDLNGNQHHPRTRATIPWNGAAPFCFGSDFTFARWTTHIQAAYRAEVHTNTTINTGRLIDLKAIGHADLLSRQDGNSTILTVRSIEP